MDHRVFLSFYIVGISSNFSGGFLFRAHVYVCSVCTQEGTDREECGGQRKRDRRDIWNRQIG